MEEAGGGKGRERPWRRVNRVVNVATAHDDPQAAAAAEVLDEFWITRTLDRANAALRRKRSWPAEWLGQLGESQSIRYVTPAEAQEMQELLMAALDRYRDRNADPSLRPPGAGPSEKSLAPRCELPVEYLVLSYPLLDLASRDGAQDAPRPGRHRPPGPGRPGRRGGGRHRPRAGRRTRTRTQARRADSETNQEKELPIMSHHMALDLCRQRAGRTGPDAGPARPARARCAPRAPAPRPPAVDRELDEAVARRPAREDGRHRSAAVILADHHLRWNLAGLSSPRLCACTCTRCKDN